MKTELMDLNGKKVKDVNLEKTIFGIEPNDVVLKDAIVLGYKSICELLENNPKVLKSMVK